MTVQEAVDILVNAFKTRQFFTLSVFQAAMTLVKALTDQLQNQTKSVATAPAMFAEVGSEADGIAMMQEYAADAKKFDPQKLGKLLLWLAKNVLPILIPILI